MSGAHLTIPSPTFWYSPETSKAIVSAFLGQGDGAFLAFKLRYDPQSGAVKLDWLVPGGHASRDGGDPPGGDDSNACPPNFPPGQTTCP